MNINKQRSYCNNCSRTFRVFNSKIPWFITGRCRLAHYTFHAVQTSKLRILPYKTEYFTFRSSKYFKT